MRNSIYWLITDTHFGAKNKMLEFRPPDYGKLLISNCKKLVAQQDVLIHLGDVIDNGHKDLINILSSIVCKSKVLVKGNHDRKSNNWYLNNGFDFVCDSFTLDDILLSHIPQDNLPKNIRLNIHGHFHDNPEEKIEKHEPHIMAFYRPNKEKYKLLALEHVNYCPVDLMEFAKKQVMPMMPIVVFTEGRLIQKEMPSENTVRLADIIPESKRDAWNARVKEFKERGDEP